MSVAKRVAGSFDALPESALRLLDATAVLGGRASLSTAAVVGGCTDPRGDAEHLEVAGFARLERQSAGILVLADGLADVLLDRLTPAEARRLHLAAADVLGGDRSLDHRLAGSSGPDPKLAVALEDLAFRERTGGRLEDAGRHLAGAAGLTADPNAAALLALDACEAYLAAGAFDRAEAMGPLVEQARDPRRDLALGTIDLDAGRVGAARTRLEPLALTDETGVLGALAACGLGVLDNLDGDAETALRWAELAARRSGGIPDLLEAARASLGFIHAVSGRTAEALEVLEGLPEDRATVPRQLLERMLVRGVALYWAGDWETGDHDMATVGSRPDATHRQRALALGCLGASAFRAGRWEHSAMLCDQALAAAADGGVRQNLALLHSYAALVPAGRGDVATARRHVREAQARARLTDLRLDRVYAIHAEVTLAHAEDRPEHVVAAVERERDLLDAGGLATHGVLPWRELYAEALLRSGREAEAADVLAVVDRDARVRLAPQADAVRGRILAAQGDLDGAMAVLVRGLRRAVAERLPFDAALVEDAWADVVAAHDPRSSQQRRASAAARFEQLGARPYVERCAQHATEARLRRADPVLGLTRAEREIVGRVAEGLTNREVAAAMVISERTVEFHLGNVYRKLGVRSRTAAVSVLQGRPSGGASG